MDRDSSVTPVFEMPHDQHQVAGGIRCDKAGDDGVLEKLGGGCGSNKVPRQLN